MNRRRILVALLLGALTGLAALAGSTPAARADGLSDLCKEVPAPVRPDYQVAGQVMEKPRLADVPDTAPDPFADPAVPISEVYGWAWRWTNYDLGCGNDFIRDPNAVVNTGMANLMFSGVAFSGASMQSLEQMSRSFGVGWLISVIASVTQTLEPLVLQTALPLALIVVGLVIGYTAARASYAETMRRALTVVGCVAAAVFTLVFPVTAASTADQAARKVSEVSGAGFPTAASDLIVRSSIYPAWLVGNFGSADSEVATTYGPQLLAATTYTWSDVKRIQGDPAAKRAIDAQKAAAFTRIAREVKAADPAAYASLTGRVDTRTSSAVLAGFWVAVNGFFVTLAGLVMALGRLIMIGLVVVTPLAVVVGVVRFEVLQRLWDVFTAAVLNIAKFTIAAGVMTLLLGGLQTAPVGVGWKLLLTALLTVLAVMVTKPVRSFKSMTGLDPQGSLVAGWLRRGGSALLGFAAGRRLDDRDGAPEGSASTSPGGSAVASAEPYPGRERQQPVEPSMPPLPAPRMPALPAGRPAAVASPAVAVGSAEQRPWPGAERFGPPARPAVAAVGPGPVGADRGQPVPVRTEPDRPRRHGPAVGRTREPAPAPAPGAEATRPGLEVVYPDGIIVQRSAGPAGAGEPGLYHSSGPTVEEYLRLPEPQLDADGREASGVTYHSGRLVGAHAPV